MTEMVVRDEAVMPTTFEGMLAQADVLVKSGLLPVEIKTPAAAVAIMLTGRELGIPTMQALRSIFIVKGKPTLSAQLMGALILRDGHQYKVIEASNTAAKIEFIRRNGQHYTHEFTLDDAKRAGLTGSDTYAKYPKAMLFSRCMSAGARIAMPDVLGGMYTPEEIAGADSVVLDEVGEVIDVKATVVAEPTHTDAPQPAAWVSDPKALTRLWAWAGEQGLSHDNVHEALGVESVKQYTGSMAEAKQAILDWVAAQSEPA